eukprot:CAMPEP_0180050886 /NCGR_PEP_ID=MMETSP0985-20121206/854_1 /TAXON_ID=483367 /ORGANISM="non described non described, Strain CCMP 2436" /LENGTH=178 /DNA_ID=CAMNT_0021980085 /DNA_START=9 /DNA_END=542 /DNA_ORIENTATION=+
MPADAVVQLAEWHDRRLCLRHQRGEVRVCVHADPSRDPAELIRRVSGERLDAVPRIRDYACLMLGMLDASAKAAVDLHVDEKHLALSRTGRAVRELCDARQPGCAREPARIDEAVLHALSEVEVVIDKVEVCARRHVAQHDFAPRIRDNAGLMFGMLDARAKARVDSHVDEKHFALSR